MSIISVYFILFLALLLLVYYLVPKKAQWMVLLVASLVFYAFETWTNIFYVLFSALIVYIGTRYIDKLSNEQKEYLRANKERLSKDEKVTFKKRIKSKKKIAMLLSVVPSLLLLVFFKLLNPINLFLASRGFDSLSIIIPLGLSYYTLQVIGYTVDVYWGNAKCERNYFKVLLFVSFFPQVTQGPISDFNQLSAELFTEHEFTYNNYALGFQRTIWGFFKKFVVANIMSTYVFDLFNNYTLYSGIALFIGIFVVMIQLYADFSGYMDVVCGVCEMLGIRLAENFNRPFFSKSLAEFWRRWHITLGAWFKKYVFFTVGTSKLAGKLSTKVKSRFGNEVAEKSITTIALLTIWFLIGVWHSISLPFIIWGLLNGFIMIFSVWMEPFYTKAKKALHINDHSKVWKCFQMLRTFTIVSVLEVLSDCGTFKSGLLYLFRTVLAFRIPKSFHDIFPYVNSYSRFVYVIIGLALVLVESLMNKQYRIKFNQIIIVFRILILLVLYFVIIMIGVPLLIESNGGFLYAQF